MLKLFKAIADFFRSLFKGKQPVLPDDFDDITPTLSESDMLAIPEKITSLDGLQTAPHAIPPAPPMYHHIESSDSEAVPEEVKVESSKPTKPLSPLFFDSWGGGYTITQFQKIASDPLYYGLIVKATEGNYYRRTWFLRNWNEIKNAAPDRYGDTWFRGTYCYLKFNMSGKLQADYYLDWIEKAGGWDHGDIWPIVDCERGKPGSVNYAASRQQVVDITSEWVARAKERTGRPVMLYGNGIMRDLQIKSRMGCDWLWVPRYTATLPTEIYTRAGWSRDRLWAWQFYGDGATKLARYPTSTPMGKEGDISVLVMDGGLERMRKELAVRL